MIKSQLENFLKKYSLKDKTIIVGFSGGFDSLFLLDNLKKLDVKIIACHLNHNWREESILEEKNAREYCQHNNIEFYSKTLDKNLPHTELEARNQRYEFFKNTCKKYKTDIVFTAHNQDDNSETLIYRITKGTGIKGLKGIPEIRTEDNIQIYRPLLKTDREQIIQYCKKNNLKPNEDSSNQDTKYARNKIRSKVVPVLKEINKDFDDACSKLSQIATENEEIIEEYLALIKPYLFQNNEIVTNEFLKLSTPLKKRVIYELIKSEFDYDYKKIEEIIDFIKANHSSKTGKTISLTTNFWIFISSSVIKIIQKKEKTKAKIQINLKGETQLEEFGKTIIIEPFEEELNFFPKENSNEIYVDLSNIETPLFIRTRLEGDVFQPFGMKEKTKLKKYFINKNIPKHKRDFILLLVNNKEVFWIFETQISELLRVKNKPTHKIKMV